MLAWDYASHEGGFSGAQRSARLKNTQWLFEGRLIAPAEFVVETNPDDVELCRARGESVATGSLGGVIGRSRIVLPVEADEQVLRLGRPIRPPGKFRAPADRPSCIHVACSVDQPAAAAGHLLQKS